MSASLVLLPGREKSLLNGHPWLFSGAVAGVSGTPSPGEIVGVQSQDGRLLARGFYNPRSQIVFRALAWGDEDPESPKFWRSRVSSALAFRTATLGMSLDSRALRISHAESDGLPGLILDWYAGTLVTQFLCLGMDLRKEAILSAASDVISPARIYDRSDAEVRKLEGLQPSRGVLAGDEPPALIEICEGPARLLVDVVNGHKTGFYLDQAENRSRVASFLTGRTVLNCFSYTGAFSVASAAAGSLGVRSIDSSESALSLAARNMELNGFESRHESGCADVGEYLRTLRGTGARFGAIILDPPKYVTSKAGVDKGARAYKDINRLALGLLERGGILATFSCSGHVDADLFQKIVFAASVEAGRSVRMISRLGQSPDHPVLLTYPESSYLKGLLCAAE
jgi:23S rRNA (cytosine1962-C5)-methyltransferase